MHCGDAGEARLTALDDIQTVGGMSEEAAGAWARGETYGVLTVGGVPACAKAESTAKAAMATRETRNFIVGMKTKGALNRRKRRRGGRSLVNRCGTRRALVLFVHINQAFCVFPRLKKGKLPLKYANCVNPYDGTDSNHTQASATPETSRGALLALLHQHGTSTRVIIIQRRPV
jgi:hypothetical protein